MPKNTQVDKLIENSALWGTEWKVEEFWNDNLMIQLLRIPIDRKPSKDKLIIQITQYMKKLTKSMSQETKNKIKIEKMSE